jgi:enamine deaminase RidA (YjgF/YER057c/UK114 family)
MSVPYNLSTSLTFPGTSNAVRSGNFVFIAGQVALAHDGVLVGQGDPTRQAEQCFQNISALAALAGGSLQDIVRLTCYLSAKSAYPGYAKVKASLFPVAPPAGTVVVVKALLDPRFLLEVEATLMLGVGATVRSPEEEL